MKSCVVTCFSCLFYFCFEPSILPKSRREKLNGRTGGIGFQVWEMIPRRSGKHFFFAELSPAILSFDRKRGRNFSKGKRKVPKLEQNRGGRSFEDFYCGLRAVLQFYILLHLHAFTSLLGCPLFSLSKHWLRIYGLPYHSFNLNIVTRKMVKKLHQLS